MQAVSGGGAATNSGIDFQHRVGAAAMLSMLGEIPDLVWLWRDSAGEEVLELRFETRDEVDDLVIVTSGPRLLVQAKRSLSLSASDDSEFASVLRQFVDQFMREPDADDVYMLATSQSASRRITEDLRKLTEAARLNELGPAANPLSRAEEEVLATTRARLEREFEQRAGRQMTSSERDALLARIHVSVLDVERGGSLEGAVLTVIGGRTAASPEAAWGSLIALGLSLATDRLSIDRPALEERVGRFFARPHGREVAPEEAVRIALEGGQLSAGREVVLALDGEDDTRLLLVELIRFGDDGKRRVRFVDGSLEFANGLRWKVLRRTSTFAGMERMIETDPSILEGRAIYLLPIQSDDDPDLSPWAIAHAEMCHRELEGRVQVLDCLRCGRPISEGMPASVEIDEEGLPHEMGLVHTTCVRPTHRITGRVSVPAFEDHPLPPDFDHRTWVSTRPRGQAAFNGMSPALQGRIAIVGWKPGRPASGIGDWGVAYHLEDGSVRYVRERARLLRMSKAEAEAAAGEMNESIAAAAARNDPVCVAERTGTYGRSSLLLQTDPGVTHLKVLSMEARELTRATVAAHDDVDNFYAPLVSLVDADTGVPFALGGTRVLLTDPMRFAASVENWERTGITVPALATTVIRSDAEFDAFVVAAMRDGAGVVIDPTLAPSGEEVTGFVVADADELFERMRAEEIPGQDR